MRNKILFRAREIGRRKRLMKLAFYKKYVTAAEAGNMLKAEDSFKEEKPMV